MEVLDLMNTIINLRLYHKGGKNARAYHQHTAYKQRCEFCGDFRAA